MKATSKMKGTSKVPFPATSKMKTNSFLRSSSFLKSSSMDIFRFVYFSFLKPPASFYVPRRSIFMLAGLCLPLHYTKPKWVSKLCFLNRKVFLSTSVWCYYISQNLRWYMVWSSVITGVDTIIIGETKILCMNAGQEFSKILFSLYQQLFPLWLLNHG